MRKTIYMMGVIMLALSILSIPPTYGLEEDQISQFQNSNVLFNQILKEHISNIKEICTYDYCDSLHSENLEKAIALFKENYEHYLETKLEKEEAISTILKGFPITKVVWEE